MKPSLGRIVLYRSRTGKYTVPAIITATHDTLFQGGVDAGHVPALSSATHVHLDVRTPGAPGHRAVADDFVAAESPHGRAENIGGGYQEFDIPQHCPDVTVTPAEMTEPGDGGPNVQPPGTWAFPILQR